MNPVVHPVIMKHGKPFGIFFVTPGRFTHVGPKALHPHIERFLLVCSPPVGYSGFCEVNYTTRAAPRPGHIVCEAGTCVFCKIPQGIGLFPLFSVFLRYYWVLRNDHFETHRGQVTNHSLRIGIIFFLPCKILEMLGPPDILIDYVAGNLFFTKSACYLPGQFFIGIQTTALGKTKGPSGRHNGLTGKRHVPGKYFLIIPAVNEIINHGPAGGKKRIGIGIFRSKTKNRLISVIKKYPVLVAAHEERN